MAGREHVVSYIRALGELDTEEALGIVGQLSENRVDVAEFIDDVLRVVRSLLLPLPGGGHTFEESSAQRERQFCKELGLVWDQKTTLRFIKLFLTARRMLQVAPVPTLPLEVVTIEWSNGGEPPRTEEEGGRSTSDDGQRDIFISDLMSAQEDRILGLVARGRRNREIAAALGISEKTVRNYMSQILSKLGCASRTQAAIYALRSRARSDLDHG